MAKTKWTVARVKPDPTEDEAWNATAPGWYVYTEGWQCDEYDRYDTADQAADEADRRNAEDEEGD